MNLKTISLYGLSLFFIIQLTGCTPMSGTMKLMDQSLPRKPKWTNTIPQSRDYQYFVGISDSKNTLDEAKRAAISDALSDALTRKGIEVSSKYEKMSSHERNELLDEILTAGTARLGLNHVAWYTEVWEHYRNKSATQKYRAYVLMRSRKLEQDKLVKTVLLNLGNRLETTWYSALFPGWGQLKSDQRGKGKLFLYSGLATLAGFGYCQLRYEILKEDYRKLKLDYGYAQDGSVEKINMERELIEMNHQKALMKRYSKNISYACLGIYALNLFDAFIFGAPSPDKFTQFKINDNILIAASVQASTPVVNLSISF